MSGTASNSPTGRALEGVLVVDLGQVYNGPYCTMLLRQLGATIIKVEPRGGEPIRWRGDGKNASQAFSLLNGGKQGLCLDLKNSAGRSVLLQLVAVADVVVENFAPGVMERLGLGYDDLAAVNPGVILASGKGFASDSRHQGLRAMDITVQAMSGVMATTGFDGQPPVKSGPAVADFLAGTHLAAATLAALFQRSRTGRGQRLEVNMQDAVLPSLTSNIAGYLDTGGMAPERVGNRHSGLSVSPYNVYPSSDGWVAILCMRDRHWESLCKISGREDLLDDQALVTSRGRVEAMDTVDEAVGNWTRTLTTVDLLQRLQEGDIPSAPVRKLREVITDPDLRDRGMLVEIDDHGSTGYTFGSPFVLAESESARPAPPPRIGEHNAEILALHLGMSDEQIEDLRLQGAW